MTSNIPPTESPAFFALSITETISFSEFLSKHLTGESSALLFITVGDKLYFCSSFTSCICTTLLPIKIPISSRSFLQTDPSATRIVVSLALDLSRTFLISLNSYLCTPARSACPGLGSVTGFIFSLTGSTDIFFVQFSQSRLSIKIPKGDPRVFP